MRYETLQLLATHAALLKDAAGRKITFQVQVVQSPEGTALNGIPTQYDLRVVEQFRKNLAMGNLDWLDLIQFGQLLTDALFPADTTARDLLERSLISTRAQGVGLRLYLSLDRLLGNVPWECLLLNLKGGNPTSADFLALMPNVSIVRHQSSTYPQFPIEANLPARVLVALASPKTMPKLDVLQERATIEKVFHDRPEAQPSYHANVTRAVLLETGLTHVFHFSGHGTFDLEMTAAPGIAQGESRLFFENAQHDDDGVLASEVALNLRARGVRVALLNACQTGELDHVNVWGSAATAMLTANLGAVVGMQFKVGDASAAVFAGAFYESLISGEPIDQAVSKGRQAVATTGDLRGWCTSVLYLNAPDGIIFPEFASSRELRDMQVRLPLLDFAPFIRQQAADFVGRDWLFQEIDAWLASPAGARYFLIKGEPGSGKTALAARLCQFSRGDALPPAGTAQLLPSFLSAWHFCRVEESMWTNPFSFAKSLAHQLAERYFSFRQALLQKLHSQLVQADFVTLVREPLDALFQAEPNTSIVILIDSLHEAAQDQGPNIVKLISELQTLSRRVRFIVTSWPRVKVLENVADTDICTLNLGDPQRQMYSQGDLRRYVIYRVGKRAIRTRLRTAPKSVKLRALVDQVAGIGDERGLADGNFLYTKILLDDVEHGAQSLDDLAALPKSLDEIYQRFLSYLEPEWETKYQPLLAVLSVAREPLDRKQLLQFGNQSARLIDKRMSNTLVNRALDVLVQFLDMRGASSQEQYSLFHHSLRDYLSDVSRSGRFACPPEDGNYAIAQYYLEHTDPDWSQCDEYGLKHLPAHLKGARRIERLNTLLRDFAWIEPKLQKVGVNALLIDYEVTEEADARLVGDALRLSAHVLARDAQQLTPQLLGRLLLFEHRPSIKNLLEQAKAWKGAPWLRPVTACLRSPGDALVRTLVGHSGSIRAMAVVPTPTGHYALSASDDKTIKVWDWQQGQELRTLKGHSSWVNAVALTPDGRYALSASRDATIKVWEWQQGKEVRTLEGHSSSVTSVVLTSDGHYALSASDDKTIKVWDWEHGIAVRTLEGHSGAVTAIAMASCRPYALSASDDKTIKVWDWEHGVLVRTLEGHSDSVTAIALVPNSRYAFSASLDSTNKVWDWQQGIVVRTLSGQEQRFLDGLAFTSDGRYALFAMGYGIGIWDLQRDQQVSILKGHSSFVNAIVLTPDERYALSASDDETIRVWDWRQGHEARTLAGHFLRVTTVLLTPDERCALTGSYDGNIKVWDLQQGQEVRTLEGHSGVVRAVALTPDGRYALSASDDNLITVWDWRKGQKVRTLKGHKDPITALVVTHDGTYALSASEDERIIVWNWRQGCEEWDLSGHSGSVRALALSHDGHFALGASDGGIKVWDWRQRQVVDTLKGCMGLPMALTLTYDGRYALLARGYTTIEVWDWQRGQKVRKLERLWPFNAVAMTSDGRYALSASTDNTIKVWDWQQRILESTFVGEGEMTALAITADNRTVIAGDGAGRMYFLRLGQ